MDEEVSGGRSRMANTRPNPYVGEAAALRTAHIARFGELLPEFCARLDWTPEQIAGKRTRALRDLLVRAQAGSPWHRDRLAGIDMAHVSAADLSALPVMTKRDLMDNFDRIVTDRRLGRSACEAHLSSGGYLLDSYHVVASGGSSGQQGVFVYGWDAWAICYASIARFQVRDWVADSSLDGVERVTAAVAAAQPSHLSAAIRRTFSTSSQPLELFPVDWPLTDIVAGLNALSPTVLMGYSSFLPRLALEARAGRLRISPRRVITISEPLLAEHREILEQTWQVPVANGYGMSEGIFSGFCGHASHLPDDLCIVEPVDAAGTPLSPGEPSARVLVTNLYNPVLPLIRYEVTDEVTIHTGACECGSWFTRIEDPQGRLDDLFIYPAGTVIHPHVFRSVLGKQDSVVEYQVQQTADGAAIYAVATGELDTGALGLRIEAALSAAGLHRPTVTVETVSAVARGAAGKLRRFAPLAR